jgi:hypothetical protein
MRSSLQSKFSGVSAFVGIVTKLGDVCSAKAKATGSKFRLIEGSPPEIVRNANFQSTLPIIRNHSSKDNSSAIFTRPFRVSKPQSQVRHALWQALVMEIVMLSGRGLPIPKRYDKL